MIYKMINFLNKKKKVPPRFVLGFPDSKSDVLTTTLWNRFIRRRKICMLDSNQHCLDLQSKCLTIRQIQDVCCMSS